MRALWDILASDVFPLESTDRLFNMYKDRDDEVDLLDAPHIRRSNLHAYLRAFDAMPDVFLLAEAPGPWGCRFSGVPITSEAQLLDPGFPIHGERSSAHGDALTEYSANIHWRVLAPYFPHFLTWNTVPFHPHKADPLSIRTPTNREIDAFSDVLAAVVDAVDPTYAVAVGRRAERALNQIGIANIYVRHPSQGGAKRFEDGVIAILREAGVARPTKRTTT